MRLHAARRDRRGIGTLGSAACLALGFALYSAWIFLPVTLSKGRVERVVQQVTEHLPASTEPADLRSFLARRASVGDVVLDEADIEIRREAPYGARIFEIEIRYPSQVQYLGRQRRVMSHIALTREIPVDEVALERQREYERRHRLAVAAEEARQRAAHAEGAAAAERAGASACAGRRADARCQREAEILWELAPGEPF